MRNNLINERKNNKLTQAEVAKHVGITTRQYARLEAGTSKGSVDVWERLRGLFNKSIDYLLEQEVETNQSQVNNITKKHFKQAR